MARRKAKKTKKRTASGQRAIIIVSGKNKKGRPGSSRMLNPQPLPPKELDREIGGYLVMLSEATSQKTAAKELQSLGHSLMGATARGAGAH